MLASISESFLIPALTWAKVSSYSHLLNVFFFFQILFICFLQGLGNGEGLVGLNSLSFLPELTFLGLQNKEFFDSVQMHDK